MSGTMRGRALRHFLDIRALDGAVLRALIDDAAARKRARAGRPRGEADGGAPLSGHILAMLFERPSTRTRVSFDVAMRQLGGSTLLLGGSETQLGRGETVADTAQVLSRYVDAVMIRAATHDNLTELARFADVPVINGLTDRSHPCQVMADVLTFEERCGPIAGRLIAWCGDGNNVAHSWIEAAARFGFTLRLATPETLGPNEDVVAWAREAGATVELTGDPRAAVDGADCVVTDTWVSMGDRDAEARRRLLTPYQVTRELMELAGDDAIFMHCLPAHRGEEMTQEVIDGPRSAVFDEAENRLHAQKSILAWCLGADRGAAPAGHD